MTRIHSKSLIAATVAALVGAPVWAAGMNSQTHTQSPTTSHSAAATPSKQLQAMTPNDLEGMKVIDSTGKKVGDIKNIVASKTQHEVYAVISVGGTLGVGNKKVVVPLNELQVSGKQVNIAATESELKARPEFMKDQYAEVKPDDQPISEFSAFEPHQAPSKNQGTGDGHLKPSDPRQSSEGAPGANRPGSPQY